MKKIFVTIALLAFSVIAMFGKSALDSAEKTRIDTDIQIVMGGLLGRTLDSYVLDAYLIQRTEDVEVTLFNIGTSEVYIIDSIGEVVDYSYVNTDSFSTIYLSTSGSGYYSIVIKSDTCYAEGHFNIP